MSEPETVTYYGSLCVRCGQNYVIVFFIFVHAQILIFDWLSSFLYYNLYNTEDKKYSIYSKIYVRKISFKPIRIIIKNLYDLIGWFDFKYNWMELRELF